MKGRKGTGPNGLKPPRARSGFDAVSMPEAAGKARQAATSLPVEGAVAKRRIDRPGRRLGGRVGADRAPLSHAAIETSRKP